MIKTVQLQNFKKFPVANLNLKASGVSILAGGNNSGKSSILHALAIWEFAKLYLINAKGKSSLINGFRGDGLGIAFDDFTPINIPSLKYLWTNLNSKGGYSLRIRCIWDLATKDDCFLEISLALTQERLFIKQTASNLDLDDRVPTIAYLPPFAGITDREQWYSPADRKKLVGRGLAGAVLRNTIVEMFLENQNRRMALKGNLSRIPRAVLNNLKKSDPFEILNLILFEVFEIQLYPHYFSPLFHNYVKVDLMKGRVVNNKFVPFPNYNRRDIMVEGSGFLQWLSVYTFALNKEIDVLLLDEPDAHLHCSLQTLLIDKLIDIGNANGKQILMASHSTEIIKYSAVDSILEVRNGTTRYLTIESQKVALLGGLGTEYSPFINNLQRFRRVIFVENKSDAELLKTWCIGLGLVWPNNLVIWPFANNHEQRKQLFHHLKDEIPELIGISVEDRDNKLYENTQANLNEHFPDWVVQGCNLKYRTWRRWEIENYLICPEAIARVAGTTDIVVKDYIQAEFGIVIPEAYRNSNRVDNTRALFDVEGKAIIAKIETRFAVSKRQIATEMVAGEVFEDISTLINEIIRICHMG